VGLGRLDRQELSRHVAAFRELLVSTRRVPANLPARWHGHAYLLYEAQRPRLVDDGALLVGDAAGLAYAASGEGIRPAVESARLAAQTIVAAGGRYSREDLAPYPRALAARFGRRDHHLSLPVPAGLVAAAGRRLFRSGWFAKRVVLDRWFLHADAPALTLGP
jgi:flavin-dependent dehydrogenase